jgi:hypothetical protein
MSPDAAVFGGDTIRFVTVTNAPVATEGERPAKTLRVAVGRDLLLLAGFVVLLVALSLTRLYSYNLFHSLAELFSVSVALAVSAIAWHTRRIASNDFLLFLGIALAFIAITDTLHLLAYKGMGVFVGTDSDLPTQLWVIGRYEFTLVFLVGAFLVGNTGGRRLKIAVAGFAFVWVALLLSVFAWPVFPVALVDGQGLTLFKKVSEYVISALLLVALGLLWQRRARFEQRILSLLCASILVTVASELSFTLYLDPYGVLNFVGHFLKIVAFFLLYLAIVERSLAAPYSLLFRGLRERGEALERSERELGEMVTRLDGVGQVSEAAMQSLELHVLMDSVLTRIVKLMGAQSALIMLARGGSLVTVAGKGLRDGLVGSFVLGFGEGVGGEVAVSREPAYVPDVDQDPRVVRSIFPVEGVRSMLVVPLLRGEECLGVLYLGWKEAKQVMPADLRFLELLADRVSAGVFNADLYRQQKDVAEVLQREMLVLPAELSGLRFGHAYRSASDGAHVGGDFYDVFAEDSARAWMVMGDVSGHGIEAATAAVLIREVTRAFAFDIGKPDKVMEKVNRAVVQRLGFRHFATMFLGVIDLRTGELRYCSAGHPPGLILSREHTLIELVSRSLPVGAFARAAYATTITRLTPGDGLFLYTDGITEARQGKVFFGEERLRDVLLRTPSTERLPQQVLGTVEEFSGGRLMDDLAALWVAPTGLSADPAPR